MNWIKFNWEYLLTAFALIVAVCSVINRRLPRDENGYVRRPASWWSFGWMVLVDLLSLVPQPGKVGIFGALSPPGMTSLSPPVKPLETPPTIPMEGVIPEKRERGSVIFELLVVAAIAGGLVFIGTLLGGCDPVPSMWRATTTTAAVVSAGYRALNESDKACQREASTSDALNGCLKSYDSVRKPLDAASATVESMPAVIEVVKLSVSRSRDAAAWVAKLLALGADVVRALDAIGVKLPDILKPTSHLEAGAATVAMSDGEPPWHQSVIGGGL